MSETGHLKNVIRLAVRALRKLADSLESALDLGHVAAPASSSFSAEEVGSSATGSESVFDLVGNDLFLSPPVESTEPAEPNLFAVLPGGVDLSSVPTGRNAYNHVASLINTVPEEAVALCNRLGLSGRARAQRAWEAGIWAKAFLERKVVKPRATPKLSLQNTIYLVVRAPGIVRPCVAHSFSEFSRLVPSLDEDTISHAFPSKAEAKVYCLALGISFPERR